MNHKLNADAIVWQRVDDEIVCLDLATSKYCTINAAGAAMWVPLLGGADEAELAERLQKNFDISEEQATTDVKVFLADLRERGWLDAS